MSQSYERSELEVACEKLRAAAVDAGKRVEFLNNNGAKMRLIRAAEQEHAVAWGRYYRVDCELHTLIGAAS